MSSPQNVAEPLYTQLTSGGGGALNTALGGRIYEHEAPQDTALPLLVYSLVADPVMRHFSNITYNVQVHLDLFVAKSAGMSAAAGGGTLEETLFSTLDGVSLTVSGQDRGVIRVTNRGPRTIEGDAIRVSMDAEIQGTTT